MKTDRELRDEVEALAVKLRDARAALDEAKSVSGGAGRLRELRAKVEAARARRAALEHQTHAAQEKLAQLRGDLELSKSALDAARAEIARLEPLGNPLEQTRASWEGTDQQFAAGCLQLLLVVAGVSAGLLGWWLT